MGKANRFTWVVIIVVSVFLGYAVGTEFGWDKFTKYLPKIKAIQVIEDKFKKESLEETYLKITQLNKAKDWTGLYDYLAPYEKSKLTLEDFIKIQRDESNIYNEEYQINSIEIRGDQGVVDRTLLYCNIPNCTTKLSNRVKKLYVYINSKWYVPWDNSIFCDQDKPYTIPSEFSRTLSLIIQRLDQAGTSASSPLSKVIKKNLNCFDIQYASSDDELKGAEGIFTFTESGDIDRLQIRVLSKYKATDDLLTAILLSHELTHAIYYSSGIDKNLSCYENEVSAFWSQLIFIAALKPEEISSLTSRANDWLYQIPGTSSETFNVLNFFFNELPNYSSAGPYPEPGKNKLLNYVKNSPFYQKQCEGR